MASLYRDYTDVIISQEANMNSPSTAAFTDSTDVVNYINGSTVTPQSTQKQAVFNPATGKTARQVVLSGANEVNLAVSAAKAAATEWAEVPPIRRARIMNRFLGLMHEHAD